MNIYFSHVQIFILNQFPLVKYSSEIWKENNNNDNNSKQQHKQQSTLD